MVDLNASVMALTYDNVVSITTTPTFVVVSIVWLLLPLFIYVVVGAVVRGKTSSGKVLRDPMISYANFWVAPIIWVTVQAILLVFIIFPFWLRFLGGVS